MGRQRKGDAPAPGSKEETVYRVSASDARNHFPSVARMAVREGPVIVEKRGEPEVVVMAWADYLKVARGGETDLMDELLRQFEERVAADPTPGERASARGFTRALFSGDLSVTLPPGSGDPGDAG